MFSGFIIIYIFFPDNSAVYIGACEHMHATFLVVEIADRFFWAKLYKDNILLLTKKCQRKFFCLLLKETSICFNHNMV